MVPHLSGRAVTFAGSRKESTTRPAFFEKRCPSAGRMGEDDDRSRRAERGNIDFCVCDGRPT